MIKTGWAPGSPTGSPEAPGGPGPKLGNVEVPKLTMVRYIFTTKTAHPS